jgi:hypothetical protein
MSLTTSMQAGRSATPGGRGLGLSLIVIATAQLMLVCEAPFRRGLPPDVRRLLLGRSLKAFGDGYVAILLPLHLTQLGNDLFRRVPLRRRRCFRADPNSSYFWIRLTRAGQVAEFAQDLQGCPDLC